MNFALFSENATGVELCLFEDRDGNAEVARVPVDQGPIPAGTILTLTGRSLMLLRRAR